MRRAPAALLALLLLHQMACALPAAEPRAVLKGPATAQPEAEFWLKFAGSVSDEPVELALADGPEPVEPALLYSREGVPIYGLCSVSRPGTYVFVVVASGTLPPVPPATAGKLKRAYAFWTVAVGAPTPPAPPGPPAPPTPPTPPTPPAPQPVTAQLFAVAVYPADAATASGFAFAGVRDDPAFIATLRAMNVIWHAWPNTDPRVDALKIRPYVVGAVDPVVVVYDAAGNVYDEAGKPSPRGTGKAIPAPLTVDGTISLFRTIRGRN